MSSTPSIHLVTASHLQQDDTNISMLVRKVLLTNTNELKVENFTYSNQKHI